MLIKLEAVGKTYGKASGQVSALTGVNLEIGHGEYVSLLGPSGSGKSTLLQIMGCLDQPSSGCYRLDGRDVSSLDANGRSEVRNRKLGFVFQRFHLLPRATALENVALPLKFAKVPFSERRDRAAELLRMVGLDDRMTHLPSEMSGGQQQRVAIARALANQPPLLLADEPTGNLDSKSGQAIMELLESLRLEGRTVVVVTHDDELADRTSRIVKLLDGRIEEDQRQE